jgi:hypothetical protein
MGRNIVIGIILMGLLFSSTHANGMIYIWIDENNRQHYCNNPDDVPDKYKESCKVIESQASSDRVPTRTENDKGATQKGVASEPALRSETDEDTKIYMMKLEELRNYEKSGKDRNSPEYKELKEQIADIQRVLDEKLKPGDSDSKRTNKPFEPTGPDTPETYRNFRFN